jgi:hypothetical protein
MDYEFKEAANSGNTRLVRIKLGNIIAIDPSLRTFREMLKYAEKYTPDLWQEHVRDLCRDRTAWTKDYYNTEQTELSFNFSRQRLELLCEMSQYLYADRIKTINQKRTKCEDSFEVLRNGFSDFLQWIGEVFRNWGRSIKG